jgi:hypothetical protein
MTNKWIKLAANILLRLQNDRKVMRKDYREEFDKACPEYRGMVKECSSLRNSSKGTEGSLISAKARRSLQFLENKAKCITRTDTRIIITDIEVLKSLARSSEGS